MIYFYDKNQNMIKNSKVMAKQNLKKIFVNPSQLVIKFNPRFIIFEKIHEKFQVEMSKSQIMTLTFR
jgi:hypothetical protein